jgi:hypothetical protein
MINPLRVFQQAEKFRLSAITLIQTGLQAANQGNLMHFAQTSVPTVVLEAFAFELYLKCLLNLQNPERTVEGHNLEWLFNQLAKPTREAIRREYDQPSKSAKRNREARAAQPGHAPDFDQDLHLSKDAFVLFRYLYEGGDGQALENANYIASEIMEAVRAVILQRKKDWINYAIGPGR